jgi:glutamate-1-semialdehyde 2,1-aminomutase
VTERAAAARRFLPGGSSWMWALPPDLAFVVEHGKGSQIFDTAGRSYIDYVLGSGPLLRLAELVCEAAPCAEQARFVSTGTEATMLALRMAHVHTGREKILKFEGGWHGIHDYAMVANWSTSEAPFPTARPDIGGIPKGAVESVLVAPFNDARATEEILAFHGPDVGRSARRHGGSASC